MYIFMRTAPDLCMIRGGFALRFRRTGGFASSPEKMPGDFSDHRATLYCKSRMVQLQARVEGFAYDLLYWPPTGQVGARDPSLIVDIN